MTIRHWARLLPFLLLGLIIVGYSIWQLRQVVSGPSIEVDVSAFDQPLTDPVVTITGNAQNIDWLNLNDRQIFTNEAGYFNETYLASEGYNVIQLVGKDKFGRETREMVEFVINSQQQ